MAAHGHSLGAAAAGLGGLPVIGLGEGGQYWGPVEVAPVAACLLALLDVGSGHGACGGVGGGVSEAAGLVAATLCGGKVVVVVVMARLV